MYNEVKEVCNNYRKSWEKEDDFAEAYAEFEKNAFSEHIDFYKVDAILKYRLDKLIYKFKTKNLKFFQGYFNSRIMARLALEEA